MNVLIQVHLNFDTWTDLLTRPIACELRRGHNQIHEAQGSQLNKLRLSTRIVPLGVCGVIISERRKKHRLGVKKCLSWGAPIWGCRIWDPSRLEVTNPTQPTTQERKHHLIPRSNLYIPNHNGRSYEKRKST